MLDPKDYELLSVLVAHEGQIRVSALDEARRQATHLAGLGYATIIPTSVQSFAVRITAQGQVAKVLADFGSRSPDFCAIEPQPSQPTRGG
jgi:hypothetical protein